MTANHEDGRQQAVNALANGILAPAIGFRYLQAAQEDHRSVPVILQAPNARACVPGPGRRKKITQRCLQGGCDAAQVSWAIDGGIDGTHGRTAFSGETA